MKSQPPFRDDLPAYLMFECNKRSRLLREKVEQGEIENRITIYGDYALV